VVPFSDMETTIKVPIRTEALAKLQELAARERRPAVDQAAVLLERALRRAPTPPAMREPQAE
jgi:hypothetical protein